MAKMTPEGIVKKEIKSILNEYGAYSFMPVQNGMGSPALDFHCIHYGRAFCIEAKAPGKNPTPRQAQTILNISAAGGRCFVIDGPAGYAALKHWLRGVNLNDKGE